VGLAGHKHSLTRIGSKKGWFLSKLLNTFNMEEVLKFLRIHTLVLREYRSVLNWDHVLRRRMSSLCPTKNIEKSPY
jgi:hypothetical protein